MNPSVRLIGMTMPVDDPDYEESLGFEGPRHLIEFAGRWDYGESSVAKMLDVRLTRDGPVRKNMIETWLRSGEESMVEMGSAMFLITCSRVVSHELVRHRIASYQQESQRFVKYDEEKPGDLFFCPPEIAESVPAAHAFWSVMLATLDAYNELKDSGVKSQIARYVLPNATRTRVVAYMNLRQWRHVLALRMHTSAQPEMQVIARLVHAKLQRAYGHDLFPDDIASERAVR